MHLNDSNETGDLVNVTVMCKKEKYVEGTMEGKQTLLAYILVVAAFTLFVNYYGSGAEINEVSDVKKALKSQVPVLIAYTIFYVGLGGIVLIYGNKYIKHGYWPPPGLPVPFRTRIVKLKYPNIVKLSIFILLAMFIFHIYITYYSWFTMYKLAQGI